MHIYVVGARGYLGAQITAHFPGTLPVFRGAQIVARKGDVVIDAAGYCGGAGGVDDVEDHPRRALMDNVEDPIARACRALTIGARYIYLGSGCIFSDRSRVHEEDSPPQPTGVYTRTKAAADLALQALGGNVAIVRLRMPLGEQPHSRNLLSKLARYDRVCEATNSVTVVEDLLRVLSWLTIGGGREETGVFHAVNPRAISHAEILGALRAHGVPCAETTTPESEFEFRVPRSHVVLRDTRIPPGLMPAITARLPQVAAAFVRNVWKGAAQ